MSFGRISALALALGLGLITPAEADDWSGAHLTLGFSRALTDLNSVIDDTSFGSETADLGPFVALGYDWNFGSFTLGVVADAELTQGSADFFAEGKSALNETDWFASLRARVGVPVNERLHVFASAGPAMMQARSEIVAAEGGSESGHLHGVAYGVGLDFQLKPGRHLTVEYLQSDFDPGGFHGDVTTMAPETRALRVGYAFRF